MSFSNPEFLLFYILFIAMYIFRKRYYYRLKPAMKYSSTNILPTTKKIIKIDIIRYMVIALMIFAMAGPQIGKTIRLTWGKGIDIMLVLDVSGSMRLIDPPANYHRGMHLDVSKLKMRIDVAKDVLISFVKKRRFDRIGLVAFAADAMIDCPITTDYNLLISQIKDISFGIVDPNATAIGMGIATAAIGLEGSKSKTKLIILLTDGNNNAGNIDPKTAAEIAKKNDIKLYIVGIGNPNIVFQNVGGFLQVANTQDTLNTEFLKEIASIGNGMFFYAQNPRELKSIYNKINKMEKSDVKVANIAQYNDISFIIIIIALFLLIMEITIRYIIYIKIP